jgi:hypothetical protein
MTKYDFTAQRMSDFSKQKSNFDSVNKYKGYLADEVSKFNNDGERIKLMFADYNAALQDEKQKLQYENILGAYLLKLDSLTDMVQTAIVNLSAKIQGKMYPLSTDSNAGLASKWSSNGIVVGQLTIANAISIFNLSLNDEKIRNAFVYNVAKYIATGQFDLYSTLLELELNRTGKNVDELKNIQEAKKQYYQYLKITPMIAESLELARLLDDIKYQRSIQGLAVSHNLQEAVGQSFKDRQLKQALAELQ